MYKVSAFMMPVKFSLMLLQFLLLIFVLATSDEYVAQGLPSRFGPDTPQFTSASASVTAAALIFLALLFAEWVTLIFGVSLLFNRVNAF